MTKYIFKKTRHMTTVKKKKSAKERMWEFHKKNPHVYDKFEKKTLQLINRGAKRLSAKMILEGLRWDHYMRTLSTDGFKINNDFFPYYGRYFEYLHPEHVGVFEKRRVSE